MQADVENLTAQTKRPNNRRKLRNGKNTAKNNKKILSLLNFYVNIKRRTAYLARNYVKK